MTGILYPRLLHDTAHDLHRERLRSSPSDLRGAHALRHRAAVFATTGGRRITEQELAELRNLLVAAAEQAGFPEEVRRQDRTDFDLAVARLLHERSGLVAAEASVRSIWAFLALVLLPDVSYWRFPSPPVDRMLGTDITRHVWGRLWWRAHLLAVPDQADTYRLLDVFGEAAFDQIFARRRSIGGSRALIRALAESWPSLGRHGVNERDLLRDVLKRLLRLGAVVEFEALDHEELRLQVEEAAADSVAVLSRDVNRSERRHARL